MNICLPYRAEFGWICFMHAPQCKAIAKPKIVCCEPGMEALYPGCVEHLSVASRPDEDKRRWTEKDLCIAYRSILGTQFPHAEFIWPSKDAPRDYFIPEPYVHQSIVADVVVTPRFRSYGEGKNWEYWPALTADLVSLGLRVFAGGSAAASKPVPCELAWDYDRCLDATIEAMLTARLVVATDCGLAHLALLCGRPLLLIADGENGVGDGRQTINVPRFNRVNHTGAPINIVSGGWTDTKAVIHAALDMLHG